MIQTIILFIVFFQLALSTEAVEESGGILLKAYRCRNEKKFQEAENLFLQVIATGKDSPKYAEAQVELAETLFLAGEVTEAQERLQKFVLEADLAHRILDARAARLKLKQIFILEQRKLDEKLDDRHCPVCRSDANVIPISYGLIRTNPGETPIETHDMGCVVPFGTPRWWCKKDIQAF